MKVPLFLLAVTLVVYGVGRVAPAWKGSSQPRRWLETSPNYAVTDLTKWVRAEPEFAARYVIPTLFPLDLVFMVFLAALLASASVASAQSVRALTSIAWIFVLIPAAYLAIDLAEDVVLAGLLTHPDSITPGAVGVAQNLTRLKIWSVTAAFGQTALLILAGAVAWWIG